MKPTVLACTLLFGFFTSAFAQGLSEEEIQKIISQMKKQEIPVNTLVQCAPGLQWCKATNTQICCPEREHCGTLRDQPYCKKD
jgi:hypothetical protein